VLRFPFRSAGTLIEQSENDKSPAPRSLWKTHSLKLKNAYNHSKKVVGLIHTINPDWRDQYEYLNT
jgi:hypothetical protein